jgi:AraC-like DNA-binding protein
MLIIICRQGTLWNKDMPDPLLGVHDIGVLLPDQIIAAKEASADYQATMIAISRRFYNRLQHSYPYTRYAPRYRRNPATHLTDKQYDSLLNAIGLLRTLTQLDSPHRPEMLTNLLSIILNVIGEYYVSNHPDNYTLSPNELLFNHFYDALIRHHSESHEMAFYAHLCCLSPKHFSEVIKRETGTSAAEWISTYITTRAKTLLDSRKDYTIQQISLKLGFTEQASFARFFKNQTGMTPSEFRDRR